MECVSLLDFIQEKLEQKCPHHEREGQKVISEPLTSSANPLSLPPREVFVALQVTNVTNLSRSRGADWNYWMSRHFTAASQTEARYSSI
jgi:hypothetical protein